MLPLLLLHCAPAWMALAPAVHSLRQRAAALPALPACVMADKSAGELDGQGAYSVDGGTFFATWDGRSEDGVSPDGALPPGEDLIEDDLRRLFDVSSEEEGLLDGSEMDDLKLMFKLRQELGDDDFKRIFEDPRVKGPSLDRL